MAVYKNITGSATTTVITKGDTVSGSIDKIVIANVNTSNDVTITVDLHDGTNTFTLIKEVVVPTKTSLVLEDNVRFDSAVYNLRVTTAGTSPNISVIIR